MLSSCLKRLACARASDSGHHSLHQRATSHLSPHRQHLADMAYEVAAAFLLYLDLVYIPGMARRKGLRPVSL